MEITVREFRSEDTKDAIAIWNEVVDQGKAFPQLEDLGVEDGEAFFKEQSYTGIAVNENDEIVGLYILHPNNIGRCGHICNASYAVKSTVRGQGVGKAIVTDCLEKAKEIGFRVLQFNAVVKSNTTALALYKKLGFTQLGTIPGGFLNKDGVYEDILLYITKNYNEASGSRMITISFNFKIVFFCGSTERSSRSTRNMVICCASSISSTVWPA